MKNKDICVVNIIVDEYTDFCNNFDNSKLSEELGNYIYSQSLGFPIKSNIYINIKTSFLLSDVQKDDIVDMIRAYYGLSIRETMIFYKYSNLKKLFLFILGVILICISHFVEVKNDFLISEVLLIIGWGAIWEVFDNILLGETNKKFKLSRLKKLVKSKISFDN